MQVKLSARLGKKDVRRESTSGSQAVDDVAVMHPSAILLLIPSPLVCPDALPAPFCSAKFADKKAEAPVDKARVSRIARRTATSAGTRVDPLAAINGQEIETSGRRGSR